MVKKRSITAEDIRRFRLIEEVIRTFVTDNNEKIVLFLTSLGTEWGGTNTRSKDPTEWFTDKRRFAIEFKAGSHWILHLWYGPANFDFYVDAYDIDPFNYIKADGAMISISIQIKDRENFDLTTKPRFYISVFPLEKHKIGWRDLGVYGTFETLESAVREDFERMEFWSPPTEEI